jgi:hypothetical protein
MNISIGILEMEIKIEWIGMLIAWDRILKMYQSLEDSQSQSSLLNSAGRGKLSERRTGHAMKGGRFDDQI